MHLSGKLELINKCHRRYIGITSSINNELTHFASNYTPSMKDLFPLVWLTKNRFDMECSSNYQ